MNVYDELYALGFEDGWIDGFDRGCQEAEEARDGYRAGVLDGFRQARQAVEWIGPYGTYTEFLAAIDALRRQAENKLSGI